MTLRKVLTYFSEGSQRAEAVEHQAGRIASFEASRHTWRDAYIGKNKEIIRLKAYAELAYPILVILEKSDLDQELTPEQLAFFLNIDSELPVS